MNVTLSRRHLVGAGSLAGLAAATVSGVSQQANASEAVHPSTDHALLTACAAFEQAHQDQVRSNANPDWDQAEIDAVGHNWSSSLEAVLSAPAPKSHAGRVALARAARIAFTDEVSGGQPSDFEERASREQRLAPCALNNMAGA